MSRIAIHHVGGRWGDRSFPLLPHFEADFVVVLYEADADAIAGMREAAQAEQGELIALPYCLASAEGEAELHIYVNPGLTSLRLLGSTLRNRYLHLFGVDFDFDADGARLLERRTIRTQTLENVLNAADGAPPEPDFLSLDVQGFEYEVLAGAETALRDSVCGLIVEVEFAEMYSGQKRFQEICDRLGQRGFEFVRFQSIGEASGPVAPLGFRLGGYQSWADALFLRRPETLRGHASETEKLRKLCFMAIVFGNIELAVECAERLGSLPQTQSTDAPKLAYECFVAEFAEIYKQAEKVFPPVFSKILPNHRFLDFASAGSPKQWPIIFEGLRHFDDRYLNALDRLQQTEDTACEALLRRYDFGELAERLKSLRRHQAHSILQAIQTARETS